MHMTKPADAGRTCVPLAQLHTSVLPSGPSGMKWLMVDVESIVVELSRMPLPSPPRQLVIAGPSRRARASPAHCTSEVICALLDRSAAAPVLQAAEGAGKRAATCRWSMR